MGLKILVRGLACSAAALGFSAALAQSAPAPASDQSTIVVTGKRSSEKEVQDFVRALAPVSFSNRITRFEQSVCPMAIGLPQEQRDMLQARMRRLAKEVGVPVGGAKCAPNVVVMVTQDKKALMQVLRRKYPEYFGDLSQSQIREIARKSGPAVAWHLRGAPISARGTELFFDESVGYYVNQTTESASRINQGSRPQFDGAVVVVERSALAGLTVTQLADYAAMRAFAGSDPARLAPASPPTILRVLEAPIGSEIPLSLTEWDFAFLKGFYAAPRNINNNGQRSAIAKTIIKEVERPPAQ